MKVSLPYKTDVVTATIPWAKNLGVIDTTPVTALSDPASALRKALENPIGTEEPLSTKFHPGDSVVIAVSDATRKTGMEQVLPELVGWLIEAGVAEEEITFMVATGVHRPASPGELVHILGTDLYARFKDRIYNHDAYDDNGLVQVGATTRGTEVLLNRRACECDHLILTGSVVPHYFAGFGGGRKALVPGLAGAVTIARNHVRSLHSTEPRLHPHVQTCVLDGNPVAEDLLEAAQLHPPAFIVNTVLGQDGTIAGVFVGELDAAHRSACAFARKIYAVPIKEKADLVIAGNNTAPNFIQCHKALFNAYSALKPEGRIILVAPLPEGLGGTGFRRFLEMNNPEAIATAVRQHPDINGQTALSTLEKAARTILVSELTALDVSLLGAEKAVSLEDALVLAHQYFQDRGISRPTCYIMPNAGTTVPVPHSHT
jgi:lactate racemase